MSDGFPVPDSLERRRLAIFLAVAFGVAWLTALVISATGGLVESPQVVGPLSLAAVLLPTAYMFAPAAGNVVARVATGEDRAAVRLSPETDGTLPVYVTAWLGPAVLVALGAGLFYLVFPRYFDPTMAGFGGALGEAAGAPVDPRTAAVVQVVAALTVAPVINAIPALGEEFGWRGYLLPKLMPLGVRRAVVVHGLVWGVWHWPVIAMGYQYGFGYPGFPWSGLLVFPAFTVGAGTFLAWLTVREGSIWPATIAHGALNAIAGVAVFVLQGDPNPLLGPLPVGLLGGLPWLVLAAWLLRDRDRLPPRSTETSR